MIALMMFLFLSGGAKKAANPTACHFAGKAIPCDPSYIPKMKLANRDVCPRKEGEDIPEPGILCFNGTGFVEDKGVQPATANPLQRGGGSGSLDMGKHVDALADPPMNGGSKLDYGYYFPADGLVTIPPLEIVRHVTDYTAYDYQFRVDAEGKEYYETQLPVVSVADDGSKSVKLSSAEYSHLQDLRKAVADEEQRLAVKYGAWGGKSCLSADCKFYIKDAADHYTYHGQFLLIEKGSNSEK